MKTNKIERAATRVSALIVIGGVMVLSAILAPAPVRGWGAHGHTMAGKAAALKVPGTMPEFFRKAGEQLAYLNPEPDRWRDRAESQLDRGMDTAAAPDHFVDI